MAVNRPCHYVRWTDVEGLDGVFRLLQGLDGLTAPSSVMDVSGSLGGCEIEGTATALPKVPKFDRRVVRP